MLAEFFAASAVPGVSADRRRTTATRVLPGRVGADVREIPVPAAASGLRKVGRPAYPSFPRSNRGNLNRTPDFQQNHGCLHYTGNG
jgi:hypothetical protein